MASAPSTGDAEETNSAAMAASAQILSSRKNAESKAATIAEIVGNIKNGNRSPEIYDSLINSFLAMKSYLHIEEENSENLRKIIKAQSRSRSHFTSQKVQEMFKSFISDDLPLVNVPLPPLCGSIPLPEGCILPYASFACIKRGEQYILGIILDYNEGRYSVLDAVPESSIVSTYFASLENVFPMPTSLPIRRMPECEYKPGDEVLALWPDGPKWTSVFYPAVVLRPPASRGDGYLLSFSDEEENKVYVPEKFVVSTKLYQK